MGLLGRVALATSILAVVIPHRSPATHVSAPCTVDEILGLVRSLSADSMRGRLPGSPEDHETVAFIERGLKASAASVPGAIVRRQAVPLVRTRVNKAQLWWTRDSTEQLVPDSLWRVARGVVEPRLRRSGVVRYLGTSEPGDDVDDRGMVDIVRTGVDSAVAAKIGDAGAPIEGSLEFKASMAAARSGEALIVLSDAAAVRQQAPSHWSYIPGWTRSEIPVLLIDSSAFHRLGFHENAGRVRLDVEADIERVESANVIAMFPGRTSQWITLLAHHDGLGVQWPSAGGDSIYNGAQDNALGVALQLCSARAFSRTRAQRGLLVIATAAEEQGRLGARMFAFSPAVPPDSVAVVLNLDAIGVVGPTDDFIAYGSDVLTNLGLLDSAARSAGFARSAPTFIRDMRTAFDPAELSAIGIPGITIGQGMRLPGMSPRETFAALRPFQQRYHRPSDEVGKDWSPAAILGYQRLADSIASAYLRGAQPPTLHPRNPYEPLARVQDPRVIAEGFRLPYPVGEAHKLLQGNHGPYGHTKRAAYAFDFAAPIGSRVAAAREGTVVRVITQFVDGNRTSGQENVIVIQHDDSTFGRYYHLTHDGADVRVGDRVRAGQVIGLSGNTGNSAGPHLHFDVTRGCFEWGCPTIPIRFRNASEPLPIAGSSYTALPTP